jgi:DNA-binding Lrp family transcriptional regulator
VTDAVIIELLQEGRRISAVDIAARLEGIGARIVRPRIKKLVRHGIISITPLVRPRPLVYGIMTDLLIEADVGVIPDIARRLAQLDHMTHTSCASGESDISTQVISKSVVARARRCSQGGALARRDEGA